MEDPVGNVLGKSIDPLTREEWRQLLRRIHMLEMDRIEEFVIKYCRPETTADQDTNNFVLAVEAGEPLAAQVYVQWMLNL